MGEALTVGEAAARLKVSKNTAWKYVRSGALGSSKFGNNVRVTEANIEEFLAANRRPAPGEEVKP